MNGILICLRLFYSHKIRILANSYHFIQLTAMSSDRRRFLRNITLGTGALVSGIPVVKAKDSIYSFPGKSGFNMCGYATLKIEQVSIGLVVGQRYFPKVGDHGGMHF